MTHRRGWAYRSRVLVLYATAATALAACGANDPAETRTAALQTRDTAEAAAIAAEVTKYRDVAAQDRALSAAYAGLAVTQSAAAAKIVVLSRADGVTVGTTTSTETRGDASSASGPATSRSTLAGVATTAERKQADYEKAAALADRLAANAQRVARAHQSQGDQRGAR